MLASLVSHHVEGPHLGRPGSVGLVVVLDDAVRKLQTEDKNTCFVVAVLSQENFRISYSNV